MDAPHYRFTHTITHKLKSSRKLCTMHIYTMLLYRTVYRWVSAIEIRLSSKCSEVVGLRGLSGKNGVVSSSSSSGMFWVLSMNMRSSSWESSPSRLGSSLRTGRRDSGIGGAPSPLLTVLPLLSSSLLEDPSLLSGWWSSCHPPSSSSLLCERERCRVELMRQWFVCCVITKTIQQKMSEKGLQHVEF